MENILEKINSINKQIVDSLDNKHTLSVSKCVGYVKREFDKEGVAQEQYLKHYNDPQHKYFHMTKEQIIESWENKAAESKRYGSLLDDYVGHRLQGTELDLEEWKLDNDFDYDTRLQGLCKGFDELYADIQKGTDYKFVTRECEMYIRATEGNIINGRFDCLFYSESKNKYLLIDWKTNDAIETANKYKQFMQGPCREMSDCNANEYTIQLHMYKRALSETYGIATADQIETFLCQMVHTPTANGAKHYSLYPENFKYNTALLDKIIDYSYKKYAIQKARDLAEKEKSNNTSNVVPN